METLLYLLVFVVLAATVYGRHVATRDTRLLEGDDRPRSWAEATVVGLVIALCLLISAEVFLRWGARITPPDALWNLSPAALWSVGMLIARRHPLDRTTVGTGLAALLPHAYQMVLAETQFIALTASVLAVATAFLVAARREAAPKP